MQKEEFYKWVRIWGIVSFIPLVLVAGPFAGYLAGEYLEEKSGSGYILYVCIGIGFIASIAEVIRIIRLLTKISG